ncbi:hypothetical protein WA026_013810 [Henosepilachna vigintioctopunctata]|uniref:PIN domain-containing protein n=1 Tax=Henosepilachna vigintioctopunctata TaxID=420089 RepID=A0AAW1V109_9CUCU
MKNMDGNHEHQDSNVKLGNSFKRSLESEELECSKKRRLHTELDKKSISIVKPASRRSTTFANDRLNKLRNRLSNESLQVCTPIISSLLKNNCSNINTLKKITGNEHTRSSESSANSLQDGKSQHNLQSSRRSENYIDIQCHRENGRISLSHLTSEVEDQIQLKHDGTVVSKSTELTSFVNNKCELLQSRTLKNGSHKIKELPSYLKDSPSEHSIHNKLNVSLCSNEEKESKIIIEMKSPSSEVSSVNICDGTVAPHNKSLNISINSCLETENSKISNSLSMFNDLSKNKVEKKERCNNVDNESSLCSSRSCDEGLLKDTPSSSRGMVNKDNIVTMVMPRKENSFNQMSNNSQKGNPAIFEDSTKYSTNYGQIMDDIYLRFFSSEEEKKAMSSDKSNSSNSVINTHNVDKQSSFSDEDGIMEWDDDTVTDSTDKISSPSSKDEKNCSQPELYIVVDTNIFLYDLHILKDMVSCESSGRTKFILYVPWMVLTELDFMKDDKNTAKSLKRNVTDAVAFINKTLTEGGRKLIGQNIFEAEQQKHIGKSPDDKIVSCCIQLKQNNQNVILLSNDVNLKNKLLVNEIPAFSSREMFKKPVISTGDEIQEKLQKINERMSTCCSYVICECVIKAYGKAWNQMNLLKDPPPWSFNDCLIIFKKYWPAVFRDLLLKHCLRTVEQLERLSQILESSRNAGKFEEYVQGCLSLCIFLKDLEEHKKFVEAILDDIDEIIKYR